MSDDVSIRTALAGVDDDVVTDLITEYLTWALTRLRDEYGITELVADPDEVRSSLVGLRPPAGEIVLAQTEGRPAGVAAMRWLARDTAEIKRMYVPERYRGRRIGARLLDRLLADADATGARVVRLDSVRFMDDARALYLSRGFVERSPYEGTEIPVHLHEYWRFFELDLASRNEAFV